MQLKTRLYCPRCQAWVNRKTSSWCGLHQCLCKRKFHSLSILKDHLMNLHNYNQQQIGHFLHQNPQSEMGNFATDFTKNSKQLSDMLNHSFCCSCKCYLTNYCDQLRYCLALKCRQLSCEFVGHSHEHMRQHIQQEHSHMQLIMGNKFPSKNLLNSFWDHQRYFICDLCDGFVIYPDGDRYNKDLCSSLKCPFADCDYNKLGKLFHSLEHIIAHVIKVHHYWLCKSCGKYLPESTPYSSDCCNAKCSICHIVHHDINNKDECKLTIAIDTQSLHSSNNTI